MNLRFYLILLSAATMLLCSCTGTDQFSKRKYLPWKYHRSTIATTEKPCIQIETEQDYSQDAKPYTPEKDSNYSPIHNQEKIISKDKTYNIANKATCITSSPTDTVTDSKKEKRNKKLHPVTAQTQSKQALVLGILALLYAGVYALLTEYVLKNSAIGSANLAAFFAFILLLIPLVFGTGIMALIFGTFGLIQSLRAKKTNAPTPEPQISSRIFLAMLLSFLALAISIVVSAVLVPQAF